MSSKNRLIAGNFLSTGVPESVSGSAGQSGGGGVDSATTLDLVDFEKGVFRSNGQTLDSNHTIDSADNAMSAGPITVDSGITLTVNGYWSVV